MKQQKQSKLLSKKKNTKNHKKDISSKNAVKVIEQKESPQKNSSKIEKILTNHSNLKRRLPPIEKKQPEINEDEKIQNDIDNNFNLEEEINNNIENLNFGDKEENIIKDSMEIEKEIENYKKIEESPKKTDIDIVENAEKKIVDNNVIEKKTKNEIGTGTPCYCCDDIQEIKNEVDNKLKQISKLTEEQNDYKFKLNELFQKLNKLLADNAELLLSEENEEEYKNKKQENLNELKMQLELRKKGINSSKNQNKIYKQQYDLLSNKEKNTKYDNVEKKIDKIKIENNELIKQIKSLKTQSRKDGKKLEDYSYNGKCLADITKITNELKTLENKKHEYFKKLSNNNKFINNCVKEFENLESFYNSQKSTKNYFNAKVEEEINRLKEDLSGTEDEIIKRIESDNAFIIKKLLHNEKINNNIFKTPIPNKPADAKKMKLKKGNSLEPLARIKIARNNIHSGQSRRMNIVAKNKSPLLTNNNINGINHNNKEQDDFDPSQINYNDLTDYEYKEMLNKKEHCYDVVTKLEKSIKEAQKMYQRKLKEMKTSVEENTQKLNTKNKENELLKAEIEDLNKILALNEQENKIVMAGQSTKMKKNKTKTTSKINNNKDNLNNEKELESQKEYLSPEYYNNVKINHNNNTNKAIGKDKDKLLIQTHSNTDMTRNEILNDLKVLNGQNIEEVVQDSSLEHKNSNLNMKFPDLSNIEENINVNINPKNEFERNKAIDDIKKKYHIKSGYDDDNNDLNDDLNLEEENEEEKMLKEQERLKKEELEERQRLEKEIEDEKKFFKEHEKILSDEVGDEQFEPPIQNNIIEDNNLNINNNNKENEDNIDYGNNEINNKIENNNNNNLENNEEEINNIEKKENNIVVDNNNIIEKEEVKQGEENDKKENINLDEKNNESEIKNDNEIKNDVAEENINDNNVNNDSLEQPPKDNQENIEEENNTNKNEEENKMEVKEEENQNEEKNEKENIEKKEEIYGEPQENQEEIKEGDNNVEMNLEEEQNDNNQNEGENENENEEKEKGEYDNDNDKKDQENEQEQEQEQEQDSIDNKQDENNQELPNDNQNDNQNEDNGNDNNEINKDKNFNNEEGNDVYLVVENNDKNNTKEEKNDLIENKKEL